MSCILNIETSTSVCSVAASQDGQTIFVKEDLERPFTRRVFRSFCR